MANDCWLKLVDEKELQDKIKDLPSKEDLDKLFTLIV